MRDDFRRIFSQANRTNGAATLDTIADAIAGLAFRQLSANHAE